MKTKYLIIAAAAFFYGCASQTSTQPSSASAVSQTGATSAEDEEKKWPDTFEVVEIASSVDSKIQKAYARPTTSQSPMPLVVSLHTWSNDYTQDDPLAAKFEKENYNYIHPDFRGKNNTPDSCVSALALQDIDDAIDYCLSNWNVDQDRIYIIGVSGGGLATSACYFSTKHKVAGFYAWASITDIEAWYYQTKHRGLKYAGEIEAILGNEFSSEKAKTRSPLHMPMVNRDTKLNLYAGINDGYTGSVPVTHSIRLYNRLCDEAGEADLKVTPDQTRDLATRLVRPTNTKIADRDIWIHRSSSKSELIIFEGGHEMLVDYAADLIINQSQ